MPRPNRTPEAPDAEHTPPADWRVIRSLWPYLRAFPARIVLAMACLIAAKIASTSLPLVLKHIVDHLDASTRQSPITVPLALLLGYGALRLANVLLGELRDVIFGRVGERAMRRAALAVFEHLHRLDMAFHLSRRTGGLSRDIERGIAGINFLLRFMLFNILPTLLEIALVAGILLFAYGAEFALVTAGAVVIYIGFSIVTTEWRTRFVREANRLDSQANTRAVDSLLNAETVKLFGNAEHEAAQYDRQLAQWERAQQQNRLSLGALNSGQALIVAASLTWMMVLAARGVAAQTMTLGDFVAINAYLIQLFVPLNFLGFVYREIRRALTDMQRMFALLQVQPQVEDGAALLTAQAARGDVVFDRVQFGYEADRTILHGVSLTIGAGKTVAVVGASGSGKSTLARLLLRFYDPQAGRVMLGGQDLREVTQASLRARIGVVPQDTVLFNDTLAYNIGYGRPGASMAEIEQVAALAHLTDFIARLPQGYQTKVGERGLKLSGGEKQRVAIARALLKDPALLIFDEATSSLDSASERAILRALDEVAAQRTTLVIAHRLSTIVDADEIVVLEHGQIVERGRHHHLLAQAGRYAQLWRLQERGDR
ncbi:ABC transporter ATP-binding protein/permease [Sinimarinibacterium sp. NLF-5-8]|uniref:ABCB family ABC transporter ATP-binding protein/permease n=1 Tax=Sinimarinibacterium sp. NLF-5-8 TaxID=2698684 RepID=UPI00137BBAA6|nr:ABC transporter ATP-binding protein/permease [Sinimarinibacterium sp. NLF-5-8]QHS10084.1 ABC transporter ATP-binding protein/permease [Sinimarinibacterium sp. NLF-5-8]